MALNDPRSGAQDPPEPPRLRRLRRLVTGLMVTLILGVIIVVGLLVIRLGPFAGAPVLPQVVRLPAGETAGAVTMGRGWIAVVTSDRDGAERIRVLDRLTGAERAVVPILPRE